VIDVTLPPHVRQRREKRWRVVRGLGIYFGVPLQLPRAPRSRWMGSPIHPCIFGATTTSRSSPFRKPRETNISSLTIVRSHTAYQPTMASPPPLAQPVPAQSPEKSNVDLRHPIPDLQSLQGAYVGNIERLEDHAERMSESGSDLGEEIRRLHTELKRSDSRRQSFDQPARQFSTRSRGVSTSSHAASIVDLNGNARWGGYSPGGYVTSPGGSLRSGSISTPSAPIQRQRSESKASRLGQVVHPDEILDERAAFSAHPGSPQSLRSVPLAMHRSDSPPMQETRRVSSFTRKYDEIASWTSPHATRRSTTNMRPTTTTPIDRILQPLLTLLAKRGPCGRTLTAYTARTLFQRKSLHQPTAGTPRTIA
jgi:hypothetical protein